MPRASKPPTVLIAFDWTRPHARPLLDGVAVFAREKAWRLREARAGRTGDGAIHDTHTPIPPGTAVSVAIAGDAADVRPDEAAIGRLAAEHLLDRGFRHFARDAAAAAGGGFDASVRMAGCALPSILNAAADAIALSRPAGIFLSGASLARPYMEAWQALGLRLPDDFAVICGIDDGPLCLLADPPLSAVAVDVRRLGYRAAARLHRVLSGRTPDGPDLAPPTGVVARASTDTLAIADAEVAAVVRLIRESGRTPLRVGDLVRAAELDRRTLERRFRKALGRSPAEALRRHRVGRAAELLRTTDGSVASIAATAGFRLPQHLAVAFRAVYGQTPSDYRAVFCRETVEG